MLAGLGMAFGVVAAVALFGVIAGLVFHRILGWYIEGAIGAIECVAAAGLFLAMVVWIIIAPSVILRIALLVLLLVLVGTAGFLGRRLERGETRKFYDERIEQYRQAIASDPLNLAARAYLADALYKEGCLDEAIEQLSEVVRLAPNSRAEAARLKHLIREREERRDPPVACPSCGHRNPKSRVYCMNCEAELKAIGEVRRWLVSGGWRRVVRSSAVAVGVLTAVLMLGMLLPGPVRILITLVCLIVVAISVLVSMYMRW